MAKEIEQHVRKHYRNPAEKSTPADIEKLDARIFRLRERLSAGDPDLEADQLQLAIGAAGSRRREILVARPVARRSAKILAAIPVATQTYRRQIELGLDGDPRGASVDLSGSGGVICSVPTVMQPIRLK